MHYATGCIVLSRYCPYMKFIRMKEEKNILIELPYKLNKHAPIVILTFWWDLAKSW